MEIIKRMNFEELCSIRPSLDPDITIIDFLKHNPEIFYRILKTKGLYKVILDSLLEKEEKKLKEFVKWQRL